MAISVPRAILAVESIVATGGSKLSVKLAAVPEEPLGPRLMPICTVLPGSALPEETVRVVNCA